MANEAKQVFNIHKTKIFERWLQSIKDKILKKAIEDRVLQAECGNLGKTKYERDGIFAMLSKGLGYRVYYFMHKNNVYILLCGGMKTTKRSQTHDVDQAVVLKSKIEKE
jgi:putative addiction module killer protein